MAGRIGIDSERCKGCGLCVRTCPHGRITLAKASNQNGFLPAQAEPFGCTGCALCALVCPEAVITVYREPAVVEVKAGRRARKATEVLKEEP